jgi:Uma2 family endonuclease
MVELLNRMARPVKLAHAFPELRATFGGRSYVPDVGVYRWERIPRTPHGSVAHDFFEPPDVAVEIASPEPSVNALVRRCLWYVANGVRVGLLVDPDDEPVVVFRPGAPPAALRGADGLDFSDVLPGLRLRAEQVFEPLRLG